MPAVRFFTTFVRNPFVPILSPKQRIHVTCIRVSTPFVPILNHQEREFSSACRDSKSEDICELLGPHPEPSTIHVSPHPAPPRGSIHVRTPFVPILNQSTRAFFSSLYPHPEAPRDHPSELVSILH